MIPSANSDNLDSEPPLNRLRNGRIPLPEKFDSRSLTAAVSIPGAGM